MKTLFVLAALMIIACQSVGIAADKPEYLASYDPAKGFKPAGRDLTEIFLQLAGSLEATGSPEQYLRHVASEHARIEALYWKKYGKAPKSYRPAYLTDEYIKKLSENWNLLSPQLGLEPFAKDVGHTMRNAIKGTRGTGTILVDLFNEHQALVFDRMAGKGNSKANFELLRTQLVTRLELDKAVVNEERYEMARRDAISFALGIHGSTTRLFKKLDEALDPSDAQKVKMYLTSVFIDVGQMAQSELEAGIAEWAISQGSAASK